jgi:hypothetical protein
VQGANSGTDNGNGDTMTVQPRTEMPPPRHAQQTGEDPFPSSRSGGRATEAPVSPNAPSSPQWSFTPEPEPALSPHASEHAVRRQEPQAPTEADTAGEPLPDATSPGEKRGGWWQRRFRSGS